MLRDFIYEEEGMGTIEIAIIIAALLALVIVFRKQLFNLWNQITGNLDRNDIATPAEKEHTAGEGYQFEITS